MPLFSQFEVWPLVAVMASTGAAAVVDVRTRRIPNALTASTTAAGLALAATGVSNISLAAALVGLALGMLLMMPGHLLGATGAGDVKLMAGVGAILGWERVIFAFLYTGVAGGLLALVIAKRRRRLRATLANTGRLLSAPAETRQAIEASAARNSLPYAPAIAAGSILAAALGG